METSDVGVLNVDSSKGFVTKGTSAVSVPSLDSLKRLCRQGN